MTKNTIIKSLLLIGAVVMTYYSSDIMNSIIGFDSILPKDYYLRVLVLRLLDYSPILLVGVICFWNRLPELLGWRHSPAHSFLYAFVICTPVILTFFIMFSLNSDITGKSVWSQVVTPAFFEELALRAILLGGLYKILRWPFIPAVLLNAAVFGTMHLYQSNDVMEGFFIFGITAIGSIWFSWLYVKWKFNLYLPMFIHLLMNLSWLLFNVSDTAMGGYVSNAARIGAILFSIYITLKYQGEKNIKWSNFKVYRE